MRNLLICLYLVAFVNNPVKGSVTEVEHFDSATEQQLESSSARRDKNSRNSYQKDEIDAKFKKLWSALTKTSYTKPETDLKFADHETKFQAMDQRIDDLEKPFPTWPLHILSMLLGGGIVGIASFIQNRGRNLRESLFKCLDCYWTVTKLKDDAEQGRSDANAVGKYETYYRAMFDLQWLEYRLWMQYSLHNDTYREWLKHQHKQFSSDKGLIGMEGQALINYKTAWKKLVKDYFSEDDPFINHIQLVHENRIEDALHKRAPSFFMMLIDHFFKRKNYVKELKSP